MQKILLITEAYAPSIGGVATSATRISKALAELGYEVHVLVMSRDLPSGMAKTEKLSNNLTLHHVGRAKSDDFSLQQAMNFLGWLHGRQTFDLVWGHYATQPGFLAVWFAELNGLKSVLAVRGNDLDRQIFPPGDFSRIQWCLDRTTKPVAVSEDLARKIQTLSRREPFVLENVVDPDAFSPGEKPEELIKQYSIQPDQLVVLFSGELRAKKGTPFLLRAFDEIRKRRPARLLIVGDVRPSDRSEFERLQASMPDARRDIVVTGHISDQADVVKHLQLADVFLLPSLWDGMPNSLLEAMACGVPIVASDAGAIPEVINDGVNGFLVPKTHLHHMSERVDMLFALPQTQREQMIAAARETVLSRFTPKHEREALTELMSQLASTSE